MFSSMYRSQNDTISKLLKQYNTALKVSNKGRQGNNALLIRTSQKNMNNVKKALRNMVNSNKTGKLKSRQNVMNVIGSRGTVVNRGMCNSLRALRNAGRTMSMSQKTALRGCAVGAKTKYGLSKARNATVYAGGKVRNAAVYAGGKARNAAVYAGQKLKAGGQAVQQKYLNKKANLKAGRNAYMKSAANRKARNAQATLAKNAQNKWNKTTNMNGINFSRNGVPRTMNGWRMN